MESSPSVTVSGYTKRQQNVLDLLNSEISRIGIKLEINTYPILNTLLSLDVEHDEQGNMVGIGVCDVDRCIYWTDINIVKTVLKCNTDYIMHNGVSDIECLRMWGIDVKDSQLVWDTMLLGHILDSSLKSYSLKDMAKRELGIEYSSYDDIVGKRGLKAERITLDKQPLELVAKYNAMDCYVTYQLYLKQRKALNLETL